MTSRQAIHESIRRWTLARAFAYAEPCALAEERFQVGYTDGWRDIRMASSKDTPVGAALAQAVHAARSGGLMQRLRFHRLDEG
jgi:hypothetical protein